MNDAFASLIYFASARIYREVLDCECSMDALYSVVERMVCKGGLQVCRVFELCLSAPRASKNQNGVELC